MVLDQKANQEKIKSELATLEFDTDYQALIER